MIAKPQLIAKAFSHHAGCAALAIKKKYTYILASFFILVILLQEQKTTSLR